MSDSASHIAFARQLLLQEASGIHAVAEGLDERFDAAVSLLSSITTAGRVIVCGAGKTGIIGEKLSATLASVGFPSFVLHPADAAHGDLGRLTASDIVILLSNQGTTQEVVRLLPALEALGCKTIAITSNADSPLALRASVFLPLPRLEEAGPLGLAPTSSTIALLALGDALAMSALSRRGITHEDFATRHPGGMLGKTLLKTRELMRRGDQLCLVPEHISCREALHQITLTRGKPGCAGIVDGGGILLGIFTDGDLRRCLDQSLSSTADETNRLSTHFLDSPIGTVMTRNPKVVAPDSLVGDALKIMNAFQIDQVLVVETTGKPVGLLDIQDIVQPS